MNISFIFALKLTLIFPLSMAIREKSNLVLWMLVVNGTYQMRMFGLRETNPAKEDTKVSKIQNTFKSVKSQISLYA